MKYEKGEWVQRVETEVCRFLGVFREMIYSAVFAGSILVLGYIGAQMYDDHKALDTKSHHHSETVSAKLKKAPVIKPSGLFSYTPPSTAPDEPILIPMGPPPSP